MYTLGLVPTDEKRRHIISVFLWHKPFFSVMFTPRCTPSVEIRCHHLIRSKRESISGKFEGSNSFSLSFQCTVNTYEWLSKGRFKSIIETIHIIERSEITFALKLLRRLPISTAESILRAKLLSWGVQERKPDSQLCPRSRHEFQHEGFPALRPP